MPAKSCHRHFVYGSARSDDTLNVEEDQQDADEGIFGKAKQFPTNFIGCTKILGLCKQTYIEAIEFLHLQDVRMSITSKPGALFRRPDAFGMPGYFYNDKHSTRFFVPPRFCELQFMRLRHVELEFDLTGTDKAHESRKRGNLTRHVATVQEVLRKSNSIRSLIIALTVAGTGSLESDGWIVPSSSHKFALVSIFTPLIHTASHSSITISFSSNLPRFAISVLPPTEFLAVILNKLCDTECPTTTILPDRSSGSGDSSTRSLDDEIQAHAPVEKSKLGYKLIDECRKCLQVFDSTLSLHEHLEEHPTHQQPFQKQRYNVIHHKAISGRGGSRKCPTCALNFTTENSLYAHMEKQKHQRHGMIPRWKKDNKRADKYWERHEKKFGWL